MVAELSAKLGPQNLFALHCQVSLSSLGCGVVQGMVSKNLLEKSQHPTLVSPIVRSPWKPMLSDCPCQVLVTFQWEIGPFLQENDRAGRVGHRAEHFKATGLEEGR